MNISGFVGGALLAVALPSATLAYDPDGLVIARLGVEARIEVAAGGRRAVRLDARDGAAKTIVVCNRSAGKGSFDLAPDPPPPLLLPGPIGPGQCRTFRDNKDIYLFGSEGDWVAAVTIQ